MSIWRRIFGRRAVLPHPRGAAIAHPLLGLMRPDERIPQALAGQLSFRARTIALRAEPDEGTLDEALALLAAAVRTLDELDARCRALLARDMLDGYNDDGRFGRGTRAGGAREALGRPRLSPEEFCARLELNAVDACGAALLTLWYGDGGMFGGHSVNVTSLSGLDLADAHTDMFG